MGSISLRYLATIHLNNNQNFNVWRSGLLIFAFQLHACMGENERIMLAGNVANTIWWQNNNNNNRMRYVRIGTINWKHMHIFLKTYQLMHIAERDRNRIRTLPENILLNVFEQKWRYGIPISMLFCLNCYTHSIGFVSLYIQMLMMTFSYVYNVQIFCVSVHCTCRMPLPGRILVRTEQWVLTLDSSWENLVIHRI